MDVHREPECQRAIDRPERREEFDRVGRPDPETSSRDRDRCELKPSRHDGRRCRRLEAILELDPGEPGAGVVQSVVQACRRGCRMRSGHGPMLSVGSAAGRALEPRCLAPKQLPRPVDVALFGPQAAH